MGQRSNYAASKDAQIKLIQQEFVSSMGQRRNDVASKNAQIKLR
jgi:malate/lactate dehydrogenase